MVFPVESATLLQSMLERASVIYWETPQGKMLLNRVGEVAAQCNFDPAETALKIKSSKQFSGDQNLNDALEIVFARKKSTRLGSWVANGLFSKQSAEQATRPEIAAHHARQFSNCSHVLEIGTGVGMDCAAIAAVSKKVTTIEADPDLALMAAHNLKVKNVTNVEIKTGAAEGIVAELKLGEFDGLWADPSRRTEEGVRTRDPQLYRPSLEWICELNISGVKGIKISPSTDLNDDYPAWNREFIGFGEECLEQVLWSGTKITDHSATIIDSAATFAGKSAGACEAWNSDLPPYLIEPHAVLSRSRRVPDFFKENNFKLLDYDGIWGVSSLQPALSPWYSVFKVSDMCPFDIKRLRAEVRELGWNNRTEIKKRGIDTLPEEIRAELKMPAHSSANPDFGVLIALRFQGRPAVFFAKRVEK